MDEEKNEEKDEKKDEEGGALSGFLLWVGFMLSCFVLELMASSDTIFGTISFAIVVVIAIWMLKTTCSISDVKEFLGKIFIFLKKTIYTILYFSSGLLQLLFGFLKINIGPLVRIVVGLVCLLFCLGWIGQDGSMLIFAGIILGLIGVYLVFTGALGVIARTVAKGTSSIAKAFGASDKTADEIGSFVGSATARVAGAVVVADVAGKVLDNVDTSQAVSVDTGSLDVVSATPDFTDSISSVAMSTPDFTDSISSVATSAPDFTGSMPSVQSVSNGIGAAAATMTTPDMITPDFSVTSSGMIFDAQEQFAGMFKNNTFFDSNMQFSGRIDGNTIYDANNQFAGMIQNNVMYDDLHREIGSVDANGNVYDSLMRYVGKIKLG